ncbi:PH domain-containing protein [Planomonospora alba]|uniref:PH domain-containing protein n=1 Tax=Planomonospora alba TaxID=161354 RepID=UPI0031EED3CB
MFRSKTALVLGWVWMAFAALNAVDLAVRYSGPPSMAAAAVLGVLTALVFVTCLRPAVVLDAERLLVRNPLRNVSVPWEAVDDVAVSHAITITSGGDRVRCWTPQTTARERAVALRRGSSSAGGRLATAPARSRGEQAAAEALAGRTHADWAAEQIRERAGAARRKSADGGPAAPGGTGGSGSPEAAGMRTTWAPSALAALGAALALVAVAFLIS